VADSYFVLAWANAKLGKPDQAIAAVKEAQRMDPNNATYRQLHEAIQRQR
jgi:hypothetical protein